MHRIDNGTGVFVNGDETQGIEATRLNAEWFNSVQEEISAIIEAAGIALSGSDNGQLLKAFTLAYMLELKIKSASFAVQNSNSHVEVDNSGLSVQGESGNVDIEHEQILVTKEGEDESVTITRDGVVVESQAGSVTINSDKITIVKNVGGGSTQTIVLKPEILNIERLKGTTVVDANTKKLIVEDTLEVLKNLVVGVNATVSGNMNVVGNMNVGDGGHTNSELTARNLSVVGLANFSGASVFSSILAANGDIWANGLLKISGLTIDASSVSGVVVVSALPKILSVMDYPYLFVVIVNNGQSVKCNSSDSVTWVNNTGRKVALPFVKYNALGEVVPMFNASWS